MNDKREWCDICNAPKVPFCKTHAARQARQPLTLRIMSLTDTRGTTFTAVCEAAWEAIDWEGRTIVLTLHEAVCPKCGESMIVGHQCQASQPSEQGVCPDPCDCICHKRDGDGIQLKAQDCSKPYAELEGEWQPSHASGEDTEEAAQLAEAYASGEPRQAKDITLKIGEIFDSPSTAKYEEILKLITNVQREAFQRGQQAMASTDIGRLRCFREGTGASAEEVAGNPNLDENARALAREYLAIQQAMAEKAAQLVAKWRTRKKELYLPNQHEYNGYATACGDHADELERSLAGAEPDSVPNKENE